MPPSPISTVLIPGLWMPGVAMGLLAARLRRAGETVRLFDYASMRATLDVNAARLARTIEALPAAHVCLVGHSLGALLALHVLAGRTDVHVRRMVLLGPPYLDCHGAQVLARLPAGRALLGHSLPGWMARPRPGLPDNVEVGVIAGSKRFGIGALMIRGLPLPNDGVVAVVETKVPGVRAHLVLPVSHSGMVLSALVARQVHAFLSTGAFARLGGPQ